MELSVSLEIRYMASAACGFTFAYSVQRRADGTFFDFERKVFRPLESIPRHAATAPLVWDGEVHAADFDYLKLGEKYIVRLLENRPTYVATYEWPIIADANSCGSGGRVMQPVSYQPRPVSYQPRPDRRRTKIVINGDIYAGGDVNIGCDIGPPAVLVPAVLAPVEPPILLVSEAPPVVLPASSAVGSHGVADDPAALVAAGCAVVTVVLAGGCLLVWAMSSVARMTFGEDVGGWVALIGLLLVVAVTIAMGIACASAPSYPGGSTVLAEHPLHDPTLDPALARK
jgi:hypothetical protein